MDALEVIDDYPARDVAVPLLNHGQCVRRASHFVPSVRVRVIDGVNDVKSDECGEKNESENEEGGRVTHADALSQSPYPKRTTGEFLARSEKIIVGDDGDAVSSQLLKVFPHYYL